MKFLRSPLFATLFGTLLGVAIGLGAFWQSAQVLVLQFREAQAAEAARHRPDKPWDFWTLEIDNLASELRELRAALNQRQDDLRAREVRLQAEAAELARIRAELEALRTSLSTRVTQIQEDEERNLKTLAATYSNLSPRAALNILNQLDEPTAVKILALMKPEVTAALFEQMGQAATNDPVMARRAATLSERLRLVRPASRAAANN
jgi:flagellar motility protein MotE (MotC chaperone)